MAASALALVITAVGIFLRPRFSYWLGLTSALVALRWFWRIEFRYFPALNSWIAFNLPRSQPQVASEVFLAKLKIIFAVAVLTAAACSAIRLLPSDWVARKLPFRERTWPAIAVCFVVVVCWNAISVSPYRIPLIVDGVAPELTVLHVEKTGIQFHETAVRAQKDGRLYLERNDRRLFEYQFAAFGGSEVLPKALNSRVQALAHSIQFADMRTPPAVALRKKNAEGWYIRTGRGVLAFTSEYGTEPPKEIVDLFQDLHGAVTEQKEIGTVTDVCVGFCYDPLAGLGLSNMNDRCTEKNGTRCR